MTAKHSAPVRGLMAAGRSPSFEGLFGRMFRSLPPATFGKTENDNITNLTSLGVAMSSAILIGQGVDKPDKALPNILSVSAAFKQNCPLWTYILAEAMHFKEAVKAPVTKDITIQTPRLGPVGGRIVAEVFLGLMHGDKNSMLNLAPNWQPDAGPDFKLKDFVKYALGK